MLVILRRTTLFLLLAVLWGLPYWFPLDSLARVQWSLLLPLRAAWPAVLVWSTLDELSRFEARRGTSSRVPWLLAVVMAATLLIADRALWPSLCATAWSCLDQPDIEFQVHHGVVTDSVVSIGLPAAVILALRLIRPPIRLQRPRYDRWLALVALSLVWTTSFIGHFLFVAAAWSFLWLREWPRLEGSRQVLRKWSLRLCVALLGLAIGFGFGPVLSRFGQDPWLGTLAFTLFIIGGALVFVVVCNTGAELLARAVRSSRTVHTRMLLVGLASAGVGVGFHSWGIDVGAQGQQASWMPSLALALVALSVVASTLSEALSRHLSNTLKRSARAITALVAGDLDVRVDASSRDEVGQIARTLNHMIVKLKEAEFLERINADLRAHSGELARTLQALHLAQADLVRSERMASVATLVGGIAHELNNPINYIAGNMVPLRRYSEFLSRAAIGLCRPHPRDESTLYELTHLSDEKDAAFVVQDLTRLTRDVSEGARRAQLIVSDLQSLTSVAQRGVERVDLHRVVRQTLLMLKQKVPPGVTIETQLATVPLVVARAGQLEQVLVNLVDNALRAVDSHGSILVRAYTVGEEAVIEVSDDGPGMTEDVKRQALEPFFTTRPAGEGSGLGLAIVASIARAHRATLSLSSDPGDGSTVTLRIPWRGDSLTEAESFSTLPGDFAGAGREQGA